MPSISHFQLADSTSDDALWAQLLGRHLNRINNPLKPSFKVFVNKNCCDLEAGTWKPKWDFETPENPPVGKVQTMHVQTGPLPGPSHASTPVKRSIPPAQGQLTASPIAAVGGSVDGASLPASFRLPPNATTAMVYRGKPTEAGLRHMLGYD